MIRRQAFFKHGAWIIALALAAAVAVSFALRTDHRSGRRPGWDTMPPDWFSRKVRTEPARWARQGPRLTLDAAAAHVIVIPEDRADIAVEAPGLTLVRDGKEVTVSDGSKPPGLFGGKACGPAPAKAPEITVHAPRTLEIAVLRGAVDGAVGPISTLQFASSGCGRWTLGDASKSLWLAQSGGGRITAGAAPLARVRVHGEGEIILGRIGDGLDVYIDGPGAVAASGVDGRWDAELWGEGSAKVTGGITGSAYLFAKGTGVISHGGSVAILTAEARGKARIDIALVTGQVTGLERENGKLRYARPANRRFCRGMDCN